ncbi:hypothetical protein Lal_00041897 [Lupinus albus]|nr:hypothetical protein Lal_00041897 [Lupinus albus]
MGLASYLDPKPYGIRSMGPSTYMLLNSSTIPQCGTSPFTLVIPNISPSSVSYTPLRVLDTLELNSLIYLHRRWLVLSSTGHAFLTSRQEDFRHKDPSWIYRPLCRFNTPLSHRTIGSDTTCWEIFIH